MTVFVYKSIRQAKLFCIYCINEDVGIQKPVFDSHFLVHAEVITLHRNASLFWEAKKYTKRWQLVEGLTVAKPVA